jgi:tetratricopeptide (TPR) repeat protein
MILHQHNEFDLAENCYAEILKRQPSHFDANHLLGILRSQQGRNEEALELMKAALRVNPHSAPALSNMGLVLGKLGRAEDAVTCFDLALAIKPDHAEALKNRGLSLMGLRRPAEALASFDRALALRPDDAEALKHRGAALRQLGRPLDAMACYEVALLIAPDDADAHNGCGTALLDLQRPEAALAHFEQAAALAPGLVDALFNRGNVLMALQRAGEALASFDQVLALKPDDAEALDQRATALRHLNRLDEALASLDRLLALKPDFPELLNNRGNLLIALHRPEEALSSYDRALALKPDYAEALNNRGTALRDLNRLEEALSSYDRALALKPDYVEALNARGTVLRYLNRLEEALSSYDRALALKPDYAEVYSNRGNALRDLNRLEEALSSYDRALALRPDYAEVLSNRGNVLRELDRPDEALASFERAIAIRPQVTDYHVMSRLLLPSIVESIADIARWRARYRQGIDELMARPGTLDASLRVSPGSFYLAYHDTDDRPVMEALSRLFRAKAPALNYTAPHIGAWRYPTARRLRIGFCSQFLVGHTIGKLYQGFLRHLDRTRFEVTIIHAAGAKRDRFSGLLDAACDRVVGLSGKLPHKQQQVADLQLDALLYPDIGMSPETYYLAHARLAPVQAVSYGHPDTTGIATLDYFLGGDAPLEPAGAEAHYSERLVRLSRMPFFYDLWLEPDHIPPRAALGLPESGTLYGCPQSLFKLHPDFDAVLAAIAAGDPGGHIVLIDGYVRNWNERLRARWARSAPILNERVRFVPRMPLDKFMALMAHFDVLLDPIHFGSGNTFYEGMVYGAPVITWPGRFARGRFVPMAYHQMGLTDVAPIAGAIGDYAELALAYGRDPARRAAFREQAVAAGRARLYADPQVVREVETFLLAAIAAAGRGEHLPAGWRPGGAAGVKSEVG